MRIAAVIAAIVSIAAVVCLMGCEGDAIYSIDGDWAIGTVRFSYGGGKTWTLRDVLITVDTMDDVIYFSGYDSEGQLWGYYGEYDRTVNRVVAQDLPEIDFGSEDLMDLRLEFTSSRVDGAAINWVYDGDDLTDVGAANVGGHRVYSRAAREMDAAAGDEKQPKLQAAE
ncbi:MAG: hypothetical protein U9R79_07005 [Armatimonadota bacterium]|nr:hypothetical protein [Armatimonadota bacterium]